ncbi:hypothetical protein MVEN_01018600 [Mycena venus]|uniref:Uncharacterized protein n=1 Tax=Mycena venus TaxID=2733690 RepID=A0A8H7D2P1_9AGAR|nr:hypothetical protein MVEN_01018600 [Mycena venus]
MTSSPPLSTVSSGKSHNRHYSIDLSLELERQLDMESLPPTPAPPPQGQQQHVQRPSMEGMPLKMPDIDPHVLAHIISQLRHQLADMTKERDDLIVLLHTAHTKEAELQDALQHITDKAMALDEALSDSRRQNRDDTEAISLLRTKVEESRWDLGSSIFLFAVSNHSIRADGDSCVSRRRAAADSRPPSIPAVQTLPPAFTLGPPSSRRASFTPMTGTFAANSLRPNGHHRISSVSDTSIDINLASPVPERGTFNLAAAPPPATNNRRLSGFFGHSSPRATLHPPMTRLPSGSQSGSGTSSPDELEKLRKEVRTLQTALDETRHELTEANEAREASETCVGALREFIAENNLGAGAGSGVGEVVKLPPLPATTTGGEGDESRGHKKTASGWGFKLWKVDTNVKGSPGPASDVTATGSPVIPAAAPSAANGQQPGGAPLARKLTGFFGSRASVSSVASTPSLAPLQTQTSQTAPRQGRDSVYSLSDASSVAEPISPTSQGAGGPEVRIKEGTGSPDLERTEPMKDVEQVADDALSLRSTPSVGV